MLHPSPSHPAVLALLWGARTLWYHPLACAGVGSAAYGLTHYPHHMTALALLTFLPATFWMLASHFWTALFLYATSLTVYAFADEGDKARLCASGATLSSSLAKVLQGEWTVLRREIRDVPAVRALPGVLSSTVKSLGDEATGLAERAYGAKLPAARAALGLPGRGGGDQGGSGRGPIGYEAGQDTSELSTSTSTTHSSGGVGLVGGGGAGDSEAQVEALTRGALAEAKLASMRAQSEHELDRQTIEEEEEAIPELLIDDDAAGFDSRLPRGTSGYVDVLEAEERHVPDGIEAPLLAVSAGGGGGQPGYGMPSAALAHTAQPQLP